jgi:predicted lipase
MKDKLIEILRSVPITDKTYAEYIEAVAERLIAEDYRKTSDVAREIFQEIEKFMSPYRYPIIAELKEETECSSK